MAEARRPPPPIELSILTGFLGAGKTTLLNRLLRDPALADTLVLINEFGEVGLDHLLVERVEGETILLTSGCLCCSLRGELVEALENALRARDNGRTMPFTRVVIETTGLADPGPVLHTVMSHPYLRLRFRLRSVATLVDASGGAATLDAHPEAAKQVALADRLVLTKLDLAASALERDNLALRLHALNPSAPLIDGREADAVAILGGPSYDPEVLGSEAAAWLAAEPVEASAHHDHHDHAHHHHGDINAFVLRHRRPVAAPAVTLFIELLCSAYGTQLLRLKGLIATADDPSRPLVVHVVGHVAHPPQRLDRWPDADRDTRIVLIVRDLAPGLVEELWLAAAGEPRPDQADLATRAAKPLGFAPGGLLG